MWLRKGIKLLEDTPGTGPPVERQENYLVTIRLTLNRGDVVRRPESCLSHRVDGNLETREDGSFHHVVRVDRGTLIAGIFYALLGMHVGGRRRVSIAPHLGYKDKGIPGVIPPNAKLIADIEVLEKA